MSRVTPPVNRAIRKLAAHPSGLLSSTARGGYGYTQSRNDSLDLLTGNDKIIRSYTTPSRPLAKNTSGSDILTANDKIIRSYSTRPRCASTSGSDILIGNDKIIRSYTIQARPQCKKGVSGSDILTGNDKIIRPYTTNTHSRLRRASSTSAHHRPLMQGFSTSAVVKSSNTYSPSNVQVSVNSIDNWVFPPSEAAPPLNPFEKLRVPLLPDNYAPNRAPGSPHALDTPDVVFMAAEEPRIVAAFPEDVSAMSEVVGDESRDMSLSDLTKMVKDKFVEVQEPGVLKSLLNDVLDDVFGQKQQNAKLAH